MPRGFRIPFKNVFWKFPKNNNTVYITFDDGPTPQITEAVLEILANYKANATFFLIGKNAEEHPIITEKILNAGHRIGQHTHNHLNGFKTDTKTYLSNIHKANEVINSDLFRPPYGRIRPSQIRRINDKYRIIMWTIISGDYDASLRSEDVFRNAINGLQDGDIIVFHDSIKAWPHLKEVLPRFLEYLSENGFKTDVIQ